MVLFCICKYLFFCQNFLSNTKEVPTDAEILLRHLFNVLSSRSSRLLSFLVVVLHHSNMASFLILMASAGFTRAIEQLYSSPLGLLRGCRFISAEVSVIEVQASMLNIFFDAGFHGLSIFPLVDGSFLVFTYITSSRLAP